MCAHTHGSAECVHTPLLPKQAPKVGPFYPSHRSGGRGSEGKALPDTSQLVGGRASCQDSNPGL